LGAVIHQSIQSSIISNNNIDNEDALVAEANIKKSERRLKEKVKKQRFR
jgi:predicted GIY-YIG superfamily endonuclease